MKFVNKKVLCIEIVMWLFFVGLHTFVRMVSYVESQGMITYLLKASLVLVLTVLIWSARKKLHYLLDKLSNYKGLSEYRDILVLCILCLIPLTMLLEIWGNNFSIYTYRAVDLGAWLIPKTKIYDIFSILIFPWLIGLVFRKMKYSIGSLISAVLEVLGITFWGVLIFGHLNNIWLVELMFLNFVTIISAIYIFVWKKPYIKKRIVIALLACYALVWNWLLGLFHWGGRSLTEYLFSEWNAYRSDVHCLMNKACFIGTLQEVSGADNVQQFLVDNSNYVHQLLYYKGWSSIIIMMIILSCFLWMLAKMLRIKNELHRSFLVYMAAFWNLAVRIVMGSLFTFAIVPYPVALPFAGDIGLYTDTMAFGLLLCCAYENYKEKY